MRVVFLGMGFSSLAAARAIRARHPEAAIAGTSRSEAGVAALAAAGFDGHRFDGTTPSPTLGPVLREATHVVLSIAPDEAGDPALLQHRADFDAAAGLEWLCYYSTVGVYGDHGGDWIDESAPTNAVNPRSQRRVVAEAAWRDYARTRGVPLAILRLAGIYGTGRSTFDKLRDGSARRVIKPGQVFNRIHVADIAHVTALGAERRLDGAFNLADDEPAPPQDLVTHAAELMGIAPPPEIAFEDASFSPMQRSFYNDNKRVSNRAIRAALAIEMLYPTYREGLAAIRAEETSR
jgi:nucleoside-diphosphate-sugar epimerase